MDALAAVGGSALISGFARLPTIADLHLDAAAASAPVNKRFTDRLHDEDSKAVVAQPDASARAGVTYL